MNILATAMLLAAAMLIVGWKSRMSFLRLPELPRISGKPFPDVTVIVPARNEAPRIGRLVQSLSGLAVVVVDDHSTDDTSSIARAAGATVMHAPDLPEGALGKPHACQYGSLAVPTRWLLFVDADTWYEPGFVPSLVQYAEQEQLEMVSVFLRQHTLSLPERILLPYAFGLYFVGVNAGNVNSSVSREALANGQCLLIREDAYLKLGGHKAVIDSVIEDVALARLAKKKQILSRVIRAETLGSVRMYESFQQIRKGFEKNSFRFLLVNPVSGLLVIAASIAYTSYLPLMLVLAFLHQWVAFACFSLVPGLAMFPWYRSIGALWMAPVAIYLFQVIALVGMVKTLFGAKTDWKGRPVG